MIVDSKEKFEAAVCTAMDATAEIYESMSAYLQNAEQWAQTCLLGKALYEQVDTLPEEVVRQLELIVSLRAFTEAIPFLDLILTPTGFGIVSNEHIAPASKDRVDRLVKRAVNVLDDAIDTLILQLQESAREAWAQDAVYNTLTASLFWTAEDLRRYAGKPSAHRSLLMELSPAISKAEQFICEYISRDYFSQLIEGKRSGQLSGDDKLILPVLYKVVGLLLNGEGSTAEKELRYLVTLMEQYGEKFPAYLNSEEYKLRKTPGYENKKRHSVYFFG